MHMGRTNASNDLFPSATIHRRRIGSRCENTAARDIRMLL